MKRRPLSRKEVEHIAQLACIELTEKEKVAFTRQFNDILNYFATIDTADTNQVPPTYHVLNLTDVYRPDQVTGPPLTHEALQNAPKKEKKFVKAPRII